MPFLDENGLAHLWDHIVSRLADRESVAYQYAKDHGYTGTEAQFGAELAAQLVATPQSCGTVGSGDDTAAFQAALANYRRVFVPGGNYNINGELIIRDNCELELAQDAVLYFKQTSGNCISMKQCAHLKGNHATVSVPYTFSGNVIYVDTGLTTSVNECPPFAKWDPMWKNGRYLTDLNIVKPDTRGFYYSMDGTCNGTAVYLSADGNDTTTWLWGVNFSGLRIAGAFTYGIHAENFNFEGDGGWNHEMRIEAFIDGSEVGVRLDNCHNAYLSTIVQPRRAYTTSEEYIPYAKWGICLNNSRNIDLTGSRVWDWDSEKSLWTETNDNQHLALLGNCSGAILTEYLYYYYRDSNYDIRDLIYTDTPSNLERMTILQEPFTRWFKPIDHKPYFFDGDFNKRLFLDDDMGEFFESERIATFVNRLTTAIDKDGSVFNDIGYMQSGGRWTTSGDFEETPYKGCTGLIPITQGSTIYTSALSFANGDDDCNVILFDSAFNKLTHGVRKNIISNAQAWFFDYEETDIGFNLTVKQPENVAYAAFSLERTDIGENPIVTVDQEIGYYRSGYLADTLKVTTDQVEGLSDILGSYINDVDALIGGDS